MSVDRAHTAVVTFAEAQLVAAELVRRLASAPWWRGVGVERNETGGFGVAVRFSADAEVPALPAEIDGVPIRAVRRGLAQPR